jgi:molybdenum cofactor cytidylyltransferase
MGDIWAIILAAGESKRMKVPKLLLPFNGKTMIEVVIRNVSVSAADHTLVVLGAFRDEISSVTDGYQVETCYNEKFRDGMFSSVLCGINYLPETFEAVLIIPGDQPFIKPEVINRLIAEYRNSGKGIVIPVYKKKRGHPLLLDGKYRNMLDGLQEQNGLRSLAEKYPDDVLEIVTNSPGILKDFDTKEDYLNEINKSL